MPVDGVREPRVCGAPGLAHLGAELAVKMALEHPLQGFADDVETVGLRRALAHRLAVGKAADRARHCAQQPGAVKVGPAAEQPAQTGAPREQAAIEELRGEYRPAAQLEQGTLQQLDLVRRHGERL